jgi:WD repeat-containing protein 35
VALQQWSHAVKLAEQHRLEDIGALLAQYAEHLMSKGDLKQAVELYRKAGRKLDAANIMFKVKL